MDRNELLERVLNIYAGSYDIERCDAAEAPLVVKAAFHEHNVSYMLVKSAEMYSTDRHEYAFFYDVPHLTKEIWEACMAKTLALGEPLVEPKKGHMSTNLVTMVICDDADADALDAAKKVRIRKSFQFSLQGWMEVQAVVAEVGKAKATSNAAGWRTAEFLKNLFHPRKRGFLKRFLR